MHKFRLELTLHGFIKTNLFNETEKRLKTIKTTVSLLFILIVLRYLNYETYCLYVNKNNTYNSYHHLLRPSSQIDLTIH